jgi:hypothetical protein
MPREVGGASPPEPTSPALTSDRPGLHGEIAQMEERRAHNAEVEGSGPSLATARASIPSVL